MPGWANADNKFGLSPYIVGTTLGDGCNYILVQTAIDDATAAGGGKVFIRPGTYTENLVWSTEVSLIGVDVDGRNGDVIIVGDHSMTTAGKRLGENINFSGPAGNLFVISHGVGDVYFELKNCNLVTAAFSLIVATPAFPATSTIVLSQCTGSCSGVIAIHMNGNGSIDIQEGTEITTTGGVGFSLDTSSTLRITDSTITSSQETVVGSNLGESVYLYHCTINSNAVSTNYIGAVSFVEFYDVALIGTALLNNAITTQFIDWQPHAGTAATSTLPGGVRGTACFKNTDFSVSNGFVELSASALGTYPVDNGGPGVPLAGAMSFLGSTSVDFPDPSGIETHVGATTNEIYIEDRRFLSALIVDPSATVGLRGTFTTIQAAINAVGTVDTIYVRPGTYTESLTIPGGIAVQIIGSQSSAENSIVTIVGDITHAGVGSSLALENLAIGFTAATTYTQSEGSTTAKNCVFFSTASSACVISAVTASFAAQDCQFQTAGISDLVQVTDSTTTSFDQCSFNSPTANVATVGSATISLNYCKFNHVIVATDTSVITVQYSRTDNPVNPAYTTTALATINAFHNVVNSVDASGFFASGVGTFNWADIVLLGDQAVDPALTNRPQNWQPYANTAAAGPSSVRGTSSYDSAEFTVVDGFVNLVVGNGANSFPTDSGTAIPSAGVLSVVGGAGVTTSGSGNTITIDSVVYTAQGGSVSVTENSGSFAAGGNTLTLPAVAADGDLVEFIVLSATPLIIQATGGQKIRIGNQASAANGTATSSDIGDAVVFRYQLSSLTFFAISVIGNWTLV